MTNCIRPCWFPSSQEMFSVDFRYFSHQLFFCTNGVNTFQINSFQMAEQNSMVGTCGYNNSSRTPVILNKFRYEHVPFRLTQIEHKLTEHKFNTYSPTNINSYMNWSISSSILFCNNWQNKFSNPLHYRMTEYKLNMYSQMNIFDTIQLPEAS
jgi:hypothetical protein